MQLSGGLALALGVCCVVLGSVVGWMMRRPQRSPESTTIPAVRPRPEPSVTFDDLGNLLSVLPAAALLVDSSTGNVVRVSNKAVALGAVREDQVAIPEVARLVDQLRAGHTTNAEIEIHRATANGERIHLLCGAAPVSDKFVLVMLEDVSGARRVEEVRRDFVANVSHELKTPVGALSLLAEAVLSASDDPAAVRHFAGRMKIESMRLANVIGDLVDLSRLQSDDPMEYADAVEVDAVVAEAADSMRMPALARNIEIVTGGVAELKVYGVENQIVTALRNLLSNAVNYSPAGTRVAVGTRAAGDVVEIAVTDQGIGIAAAELDRIFERFYRVDQARSRVNGGTGLGLSIVKHVSRNHGGDIAVWSVEGAGSTFTMRLPAYRNIGRPRTLAQPAKEGEASK